MDPTTIAPTPIGLTSNANKLSALIPPDIPPITPPSKDWAPEGQFEDGGGGKGEVNVLHTTLA